jgi:hypothetical protein
MQLKVYFFSDGGYLGNVDDNFVLKKIKKWSYSQWATPEKKLWFKRMHKKNLVNLVPQKWKEKKKKINLKYNAAPLIRSLSNEISNEYFQFHRKPLDVDALPNYYNLISLHLCIIFYYSVSLPGSEINRRSSYLLECLISAWIENINKK